MLIFNANPTQGDHSTFSQIQDHHQRQRTVSSYPDPTSLNLQTFPGRQQASLDQSSSYNTNFRSQVPDAYQPSFQPRPISNRQLALAPGYNMAQQSLYNSNCLPQMPDANDDCVFPNFTGDAQLAPIPGYMAQQSLYNYNLQPQMPDANDDDHLPNFMRDAPLAPIPGHDMAAYQSPYQSLPQMTATTLGYPTNPYAMHVGYHNATPQTPSNYPNLGKEKTLSDQFEQGAKRRRCSKRTGSQTQSPKYAPERSTPDVKQTMLPPDFNNASYSRDANSHAANNAASESIYSVDYPSEFDPQNIYPRDGLFPSEQGELYNTPLAQRPGPSEETPERSTRKKVVPPRPAHGRLSAAKKREQEGLLGIKTERGALYVLVHDDWRRAEYHVKIRERLIQLDSQQPGAPVFQQGMSVDITSYSPFTASWTDDPMTVRDLKGRPVLLMDNQPDDWEEHRNGKFLIVDGLVLLDQDHHPIKDYPGVPLTVCSQPHPGFVEGLRRTYGMTHYDVLSRLDRVKHFTRGSRALGYTAFTNRVSKYLASLGLGHWHPKGQSGANIPVPAVANTTPDDHPRGPLPAEEHNTHMSTPPNGDITGDEPIVGDNLEGTDLRDWDKADFEI